MSKSVFASTELWVVYTNGDTDIHYVYTDKNEAELAAITLHKEYNNMNFKPIKIYNVSVISLYDAIDEIKDVIKDEQMKYDEDY